jgi:predicted nucleic acid-binding protein
LRVYVDSSFLISLYVTDRHSSDSRRRMRIAPRLGFTPLHRAEWAHAIAQHVFRGELAPAQARQLDRHLEADITAGRWLEVEVPEKAFALCAHLGRQYGSKLGVRTLESLHVACALELEATQFWTCDGRQAKLAEEKGLNTSYSAIQD